MNRRDFLTNACGACMAMTGLSLALTGCNTTRYLTGDIGNDGIFIDPNEFKSGKDGKGAGRQFVIVRNEALQYPIYVYKFSEETYSALWMQCSHQGAELQASGAALQCPAHGSEFNNTGKVTNGPADANLRSFPVTIVNNQLFIDLRAK